MSELESISLASDFCLFSVNLARDDNLILSDRGFEFDVTCQFLLGKAWKEKSLKVTRSETVFFVTVKAGYRWIIAHICDMLFNIFSAFRKSAVGKQEIILYRSLLGILPNKGRVVVKPTAVNQRKGMKYMT